MHALIACFLLVIYPCGVGGVVVVGVQPHLVSSTYFVQYHKELESIILIQFIKRLVLCQICRSAGCRGNLSNHDLSLRNVNCSLLHLKQGLQ